MIRLRAIVAMVIVVLLVAALNAALNWLFNFTEASWRSWIDGAVLGAYGAITARNMVMEFVDDCELDSDDEETEVASA